MDNSPTFLSWSPELDDAQTYSQVCRVAAHHQYPVIMMSTNNDLIQSSNSPNAEEEQHRDPGPLRGCRSSAINTLPPIQNNPSSSYMGDGIIDAIPESERLSQPLGLSSNRQDLFEAGALTYGISPPSPPTPLYDLHGFLLIMKYLDAVLESPLPASDQVRTHTSFQPARPIKVGP